MNNKPPAKLACLFFAICIVASLMTQGCSTLTDSAEPSAGAAYDRKLEGKLDGFTRHYRVYVPKDYDPLRKWPIVIAIHGAFSTAEYHELRTGFSRLADEEGFIVLYPNGIGIFGWLQHWNAGHCCAKALADNIDDIGFIFAALDDAALALNIDRRRVYVTGFSNGGMLTHRIGAERADEVAAVAVVAGAMGGRESADKAIWEIPRSTRALPVLLIHGEQDDRVPYAGGPRPDIPDGQQYRSVRDATAHWSAQNQCSAEPAHDTLYAGRIIRERWAGCSDNSALELLSITQWRHTWPGPYDPTNDEEADLHGFDAARAIWDFFAAYQLPKATQTGAGEKQ